MRTRSRTSPPVKYVYIDKLYNYSTKKWSTYSSTVGVQAVPAGQTITDEPWVKTPISKSWKDPLVFRNVTSVTTSDSLETNNEEHTFGVDTYSDYRHVFTVTQSYFSWGVPAIPTLPDISASLLSAAFKSVQPDYKTFKVDGINIYTALLELADLKKLFVKSTLTLNRTFRDIPEKNLLVNFAILPLYNDIIAIYDIVTKLNGIIDKWNQGAEKRITWDIHRKIPGLPPSVVTNIPKKQVGYFPAGFQWYETGGTSITATGKVHLYFRPLPISKRDRYVIFQAALGLDRPVVGVWEAVPFSWAIDYFLHIDKLISRWDEALPSMFTYEFVSAGYSIKQEAIAYRNYDYVFAYSNRNRNPSATTSRFSRVRKSTKYIRRGVSLQAMQYFLSRPDDLQLGWDKGLRQASYLASLAYLFGTKR